jgi:putative sigma-54 modulation protein
LELNIKSKNIDINQQLLGHIERKFGDLIRHLPAITNVNVELSSQATRSQSDRMVAQVTLNVDGSLLRAEQRAANAVEAINLVAGVLDRRIERYKSRTYRSERAKQSTPLGAQQAEGDSLFTDSGGREVVSGGKLVKVKRFDMNPMTVEEAAFQMQLLGHRFFMFMNSESHEFSLLYQRDDGDLGMIQPESD